MKKHVCIIGVCLLTEGDGDSYGQGHLVRNTRDGKWALRMYPTIHIAFKFCPECGGKNDDQ